MSARSRTLVCAASLVVIGLAGAPQSAPAAGFHVQVIGSPYGSSKARTAVPVLISLKTARRARLRSQVGVVLLKRRSAMASRQGRVLPARLRLGDRLVVRTRMTRKVRRAAYVRLVARYARITARSAQLSTAELAELLARTRADLAALTATVDALGRYTREALAALSARVDALEARLEAVRGDVAALTVKLDGLGGDLTTATLDLHGRIDLVRSDLQDEVDGVLGQVTTVTSALGDCSAPASVVGRLCAAETELGALDPADITALGTRVTTLSSALTTTVGTLTGISVSGDLPASLTAPVTAALTQLAGLNATVSGLSGTVGSLSGDVGTLQSQVGTLQTQLGTVDATALAGQVSNLIGALGADASGLNPTAVTGLQTQVTALDGTVSGIQTQLGAVDVPALSATVSTIQSQLGSAQTTLASVCAAIDGQALPVLGSLPLVGTVSAGMLSATLPDACP